MGKKISVFTEDGKIISLGENALRIAEKHFGVTRVRPNVKEKPIELLKLPPKIEIIKAKPAEIKSPVVEIPKTTVVETINPPVAKEIVVKKKVIKKKK